MKNKSGTSHTPGPWTTYAKWVVLDNTGRTVAEAVGQLDSKERFANARLIAAAPEMLNFLQRLDEMDSFDQVKEMLSDEELELLIAKATGGK